MAYADNDARPVSDDRTQYQYAPKQCISDGVLIEEATIKNILIVRMEGKREVKRNQKVYNLDAIISVGYRIKSETAAKFRQWATQRLRDYLIQGYAINERRLAQKQQQVQILKDGIRILSRAIETKIGDLDIAWLDQFAKCPELLDDYDHENLDQKGRNMHPAAYRELPDYQTVIEAIRSEFDSSVFGKEKDDSFKS
ncbi:RhuM family protein [Dyadobacter sandarakinus]|uniref:RhuM family protein n=1 Tax=Dyadobacter sandarakinus TaxID=2747268 RepID=UPI001E4C696C|nr:RhuM family protein [Dyadobacter sandarakinus]